MSFRAVEELVRGGYTGIVVLAYREWEERSGHQHEHEHTELAARDAAGQPVRVVCKWTSRDGGQSVDAKQTDEPTYAAAVAAHGPIVDTDDYLRSMKEREAEAEASRADRAGASAELEKLRPTCPLCGKRMELRRRGTAGAWFWGCAAFAKAGCRGTRSIDGSSAEIIRSLLARGAS